MQIIRVYRKTGGLDQSFKGLDAERLMREYYNGEPNPAYFLILR